jgi:hypothetical protein
MPGALEVFVEAFVDNLRRFRTGLPLHGIVDVQRGY